MSSSVRDRLILAVALLIPVLLLVVGVPQLSHLVAVPEAQTEIQGVTAARPAQSVSADRSAPAAATRPRVEVAPGAAQERSTTGAAAVPPNPAPKPTPGRAPDAAAVPPRVPAAVATEQPAAGQAVPAAVADMTEPGFTNPALPSAESPVAAVNTFYALVGQGRFDRAAALWTPRMRAAFPTEENIDQRFAQTDALRVQRADVVALDEATGRATVAVEVVEVVGGATRRYVGTWEVVRGESGWRLDQPDLRPA